MPSYKDVQGKDTGDFEKYSDYEAPKAADESATWGDYYRRMKGGPNKLPDEIKKLIEPE